MKILCMSPIFRENCDCLSKMFGAEVVTELVPNQTHVILGAHEDPIMLLSHPIKHIVCNTENNESDHFRNKFYIRLLQSSHVFDYTNQHAELYRRMGIVLINQFPFLFEPTPHDYERTIDILFVGSQSPYRKGIEDKLRKDFPKLNILFVYDYSLSSDVLMKDMLSRARIVLNIPFYLNGILETHRINNALSCGCMVVTPRGFDENVNSHYHPFDNWVDGSYSDAVSLARPMYKYSYFLEKQYTIYFRWLIDMLCKNV